MTPNETGSTPRSTFDRRTFMRGSMAAAALLPLGGALASCASSGTGTGTGAAATTAAGSANNPFGLADSSTIDAVIFNGGYGYDYVTFAADIVKKNHPTVTPNADGSR